MGATSKHAPRWGPPGGVGRADQTWASRSDRGRDPRPVKGEAFWTATGPATLGRRPRGWLAGGGDGHRSASTDRGAERRPPNPAVARPGVPNALRDKTWIVSGEAGELGTTASFVIPKGQAAIGAGAGRLATVAINADFEPVVGASGVTITIWDLERQTVLRTVNSSILPLEALLTESAIFWHGRALPLDSFKDGGIWVLDLVDAEAGAVPVVRVADLRPRYGPHAARGVLQLTDGGRSILSAIQGENRRATEVIDVADRSLKQVIDGVFAIDLVDRLAVVAPIHGDGGHPSLPARLRLYDITSGAEVGGEIATDMVKASVLGNGEVFVQYGVNGTNSIIAAINLESGAIRELRVSTGSTETYDLSRSLSNFTVLALVPVAGPAEGGDGQMLFPITLLNPSTSQLSPNAFVIGAP